MPYSSRRRRPDSPQDAPAPRLSTPEEQREALLMYAFRALGQRALSEAELQTRMLRRTEDTDLVASVLARLRELGYLNDEGVAQAEANRRGVGAGRVRQKLRQRGVDQDLIEEALLARDPDAEEEDARALLARRWPSFQRAADPQKRAFAFLLRRGYSSRLIWTLLREQASMPLNAEELDEEPPDSPDD